EILVGWMNEINAVFFFFQAEDGIRDGHVTGVQTCALPISIPLVVKANEARPTKIEGNPEHPDSNGGTDRYTQASILNLYDPDRRSEERRVGKECRTRCAPEQ